jgi:hypothetical protein
MGILRLASITLAMNACYSPDARNWPTPAPTDGALAADANAPADARMHDAAIDAPPPPPDAATFVMLHVTVMGSGMVALQGGGSCTHDCMLPAPYGHPATLTATPNGMQMFDKWTSMACAGAPATCTFVPFAPTNISAAFKKED